MKPRNSIVGAMLAAFLFGVGKAAAVATNAGTSGAQFLKFGSGARAGAMADANTAAAADAFAAYYNPAGLARLRRSQLAGGHSMLFQDISYQNLTFAVPFGASKGTAQALAFSIYYLGVGDIERRSGDSTTAAGTFSSQDTAYALSYARAVTNRLSLGLTGKYISLTLDSYSANAFAADVGALYRLNANEEQPVTAGFTIKHIGSRIGYVSSVSDPLPTTTSLGVSARPLRALTLNADIVKPRDTRLAVAIGLEGSKPITESITGALRAGYTTARRDNGGMSGFSAGGGIAFTKANFDFAWIPFGVLGDAFRLSLLVKF